MKKIMINSIMFLTLFLVGIGNVFANDTVTLKKCVDGDTAQFILDDEVIKVRFLAIDTPESVHPTVEVEAYGKDASSYTCELLTNAKKIELEYEKNKTDKYGRYLAWVWVDDLLLQDELIKNGYAEVAYLYGDYKYTSLLQDHQEIAKAKKLNIWSEENNIQTTSLENEEKNIEIKSIIFIAISILIHYFLYKKGIITKSQLKKNIKKLAK